jgi:hypothetical protein
VTRETAEPGEDSSFEDIQLARWSAERRARGEIGVLNLMSMRLRLDSVSKDAVGYVARFYGKPDIVGNSIAVPVSAEQARELGPAVGKDIVFTSVSAAR